MADIQADSFQLKTEKGLFFHSLFKMNDIDPYGSQMQKSVCQLFPKGLGCPRQAQ